MHKSEIIYPQWGVFAPIATPPPCVRACLHPSHLLPCVLVPFSRRRLGISNIGIKQLTNQPSLLAQLLFLFLCDYSNYFGILTFVSISSNTNTQDLNSKNVIAARIYAFELSPNFKKVHNNATFIFVYIEHASDKY